MQLANNTDGHVYAALLAGQHLPDPSHLLSHLVLTTALRVDMPDKRGSGGSKKESHLPESHSQQDVPSTAWPHLMLRAPASFLRLWRFIL